MKISDLLFCSASPRPPACVCSRPLEPLCWLRQARFLSLSLLWALSAHTTSSCLVVTVLVSWPNLHITSLYIDYGFWIPLKLLKIFKFRIVFLGVEFLYLKGITNLTQNDEVRCQMPHRYTEVKLGVKCLLIGLQSPCWLVHASHAGSWSQCHHLNIL